MDYDLWPGPRRSAPFTKNRFHYNWHWFWDYGNGDLGNQGIHEVDIARWGLGVKYPTKVSAIGGHFMFDDDQETPNTLNCALRVRRRRQEEDDGVRGAPLDDATTKPGIGERASRATPSATSSTARRATSSSTNYNKYYYVPRQGTGARAAGHEEGEHLANFIDAVRSRKREDLNAEIEEGALSSTLVHLANICYRLGRTLHFDAARMQCIGDDEANKMLTRAYRAPFVVPKQV